jgi:glyoxylase-like metal-dependent hydrolase (beta-lactamase superfamily II)
MSALNAPPLPPVTFHVLPLGQFALDGGAMFGVVPKPLWCKCLQPDAQNRVPLALNLLLVQGRDAEGTLRRILVDAGIGGKFDEKRRGMYGLQPDVSRESRLAELLTPLDLAPDDITDVVFTHLHFDHVGGATRRTPEGTLETVFSQATFWVHRGEWLHACHPNERTRASYLEENLAPLQASGRLRLLDEPETRLLLPHLKLQVSGGHTPFHQVLVYDAPVPLAALPHTLRRPPRFDGDGFGGLVFWGDLIPTSHHVRIPYVMGYDEYPMECMEAKRLRLREATAKHWLHVFEHDIDVPLAVLTPGRDTDCYNVEPLLTIDR